MKFFSRKILFVDPAVQGTLLRRVLLYWAAGVLFIVLPLLFGRLYAEPDKFFFEQWRPVWQQFGPVLTCLTLMMPLVLYDLLKISNRFAGPMFRLHREMRRLAAGERVQPLHFREGDFWHDHAEAFNQILARMRQAERALDRNPDSAEPSQWPGSEGPDRLGVLQSSEV